MAGRLVRRGAFGAPFFMPVFLAAALCAAPPSPLVGQLPDSSAASTPIPADPLVATELVAPPSGPRILRLPHGASPLVALRLFVPITEAPREGGAGWILARAAEARIGETARRLGADVSVTRTPQGIAYAVSGPGSDFDYLAYLLRLATAAPAPERIGDARRELADALARLVETGSGQTELELRRRLPGALPVSGTPASVEGLDAARVLDLWQRTHQVDRMTLLFVGAIDRPLLLASLGGLGSDAPPPPALDVTRPDPTPLPRIDILRRYAGRAWRAPTPFDPAMAALARLAAIRLRSEAGDFEARVQLWETGSHSVLAVVGASFPRRFGYLEGALDGLPGRLREDLVGAQLEELTRSLAGDVLSEAATPLGRVRVVGRFMDALGSPRAAREYLDRLEALEPADLEALVVSLDPPARVTVR